MLNRNFFLCVILVLVVLITQCSADQSNAPFRVAHQSGRDTLIYTPSAANYDSLKLSIAVRKAAWKTEYDETAPGRRDSLLESIGNQLHKTFVESIFPAWYGTVWDFNGYTDIPGDGLVACGYFVSTPLKHAGFNLNRFKVAQQYSHSIVNTLCTTIQDISGYAKASDYLKTAKEGLYIVGLDNHVGFISVEKDGVFFIHASYVDPSCVLRESVSGSAVFQYSKRFVIGNLTGNKAILKKWLKNESIQIVP